MKLIKRSKRLVEDVMSWSIEGRAINFKINSLKPRVTGDGEISFTGDIDCDIKDIVVNTYYGHKAKSKISGEMKCKIVSGIYWDYSLGKLEGEKLVKALRERLEYELDDLEYLKFGVEMTNKGGVRKFDGNFSFESIYWKVDFVFDCKILNEVGIDLINRIVRGDNYYLEVYDGAGNMVDDSYESDEENRAINYAKKHNFSSVERVYLNYTIDGEDGDYEPNGDRKVIWKKGSI